MSVEEAISAATINGAHALDCAEKVGSLEPGKSADLVLLNAGHYRDLQNSLGTNLVHLTMKRGKFIYKEGEVAALPADDLVPQL
jgi:imidazolonepropionase